MATAAKVGKNHIDVDYDRDSDALYLSLGSPVPGEGEARPRGVVFRYAADSDEPIGVTIIGFRANQWNVAIDDLAKIIGNHIGSTPQSVVRAILSALE
jgi:hypothetical protein